MKIINSISLTHKSFISGHFFVTMLKTAFAKKNLLVSQITVNFTQDILFLNVALFFRNRKLKNRIKKNKKKTSFFLFLRQNIGQNILIILKNLNKQIKISFSAVFLKTFKRFQKLLFARRADLFADFINLSSLFVQGFLQVSAYLILLKQIFSNILKKKHVQFFLFLSLVLKKLIQFKLIKGLKFIIAGKLKGKPRTNTLKLVVGKISCQTVSNKINFSKIHAFTRYGVFGLKLWINLNEKSITK